jgi:hypothetical protein
MSNASFPFIHRCTSLERRPDAEPLPFGPPKHSERGKELALRWQQNLSLADALLRAESALWDAPEPGPAPSVVLAETEGDHTPIRPQ